MVKELSRTVGTLLVNPFTITGLKPCPSTYRPPLGRPPQTPCRRHEIYRSPWVSNTEDVDYPRRVAITQNLPSLLFADIQRVVVKDERTINKNFLQVHHFTKKPANKRASFSTLITKYLSRNGEYPRSAEKYPRRHGNYCSETAMPSTSTSHSGRQTRASTIT